MLVGGVGVSNAVGSHLESKIGTIATFKCLGAPGKLIFHTYFIQIFVFSGVGILIGIIFGALLPATGAWVLKGMLPVDMVVGIFIPQLLMALLFGLLITFTFALWPLARARAIPAASLFRDKVAPSTLKPGPAYIALTVLGGAVLAALTISLSVDRRFSFWFVIGALASLFILRLCAALLKRVARRMKIPRWAVLRFALIDTFAHNKIQGQFIGV